MKIKKYIPVIALAFVVAAMLGVIVYQHLKIEQHKQNVYDAYARSCENAIQNIDDYIKTGDEKCYDYLVGEMGVLLNIPLVLDEDDPLRDDTLHIRLSDCQSILISAPETCREHLSLLRDALAAFEEQGRHPLANHENRLSQFYNACTVSA